MTELTKALVAAQARLQNPPLDGKNPHFGSTYTTLPTLLDHIKAVLVEHGLGIVQHGYSDGGLIGVRTVIVHESGEERDCGVIALPAPSDPQRAGSILTYARRYSLQAVFGISGDTDDDANAAAPARTHRVPPSVQEKRDGEPYPASEKQTRYLFKLSSEKGQKEQVYAKAHELKEQFGFIPGQWASKTIDYLLSMEDASIQEQVIPGPETNEDDGIPF